MEKINVADIIIKHCILEGQPLYCSFLGDVLFNRINKNGNIVVIHKGVEYIFNKWGEFVFSDNSETTLFPSIYNRDWCNKPFFNDEIEYVTYTKSVRGTSVGLQKNILSEIEEGLNAEDVSWLTRHMKDMFSEEPCKPILLIPSLTQGVGIQTLFVNQYKLNNILKLLTANGFCITSRCNTSYDDDFGFSHKSLSLYDVYLRKEFCPEHFNR